MTGVVFARENEIITCEKGHPLMRLVRDVFCNETTNPNQAEFFVKGMSNQVMNPCPRCGSPWASRLMGVHFEDGWRGGQCF